MSALRRASGLAVPGLALMILLTLFPGNRAGLAQEAPENASRSAGMVEVPAGKFKMGVDEKYFKDTFMKTKRTTNPALLGAQKEVWWPLLMFETSEHQAETEAYAIDMFEVTNAQYLQFLEDACKKSVFTSDKVPSIFDVAKEVYEDPSDWQMESVFLLNEEKLDTIKLQVFAKNAVRVENAIEAFNRDMPPAGHVKTFDALPDRNKLETWKLFDLPEGTALTVYTRTVPYHWKDGKAQPLKEQIPLPVRYVSGIDADAFAAWAGKHVPTEEEWEKAARGPKGYLYPWGDEWDCDKDKDLILWKGTGPKYAPPARDRPIPVNKIPEGRSGYGCYHLLGNVMEWTSSSPRKYPGTLSEWVHFGDPRIRAVRGGSWASGNDSDGKELSLRNTTRILEGPDGPVPPKNSYALLGFRCAKYPTPGRDSLTHRFAAALPWLPKGETFDPRLAFGAELPGYAGAGEEGAGFVFVKKGTSFIGVVPKDKLPFPTAEKIVEASHKATEAESGVPPVYFAYLQWSDDITIEAYQTPEPAEVKEGEDPPPPPVEQKVMLRAEPRGYLIGIDRGRLALCRLRLAGAHFCAYLTPEAAGSTGLSKVKGGETARKAVIDATMGRFELRIPMLTRSATSKDRFLLTVNLNLGGTPQGDWLGTTSDK